MSVPVPDQMPEQLPLDLPAPRSGPVLASAQRSVAAAGLDPDRDALMIAHLYALAATMDRFAGRVEPRAVSLLSRELRACASDLGLTRTKEPPAESGPFDFLTAT